MNAQGNGTMNHEEVQRIELEVLRREHRDLDEAIDALHDAGRADGQCLRLGGNGTITTKMYWRPGLRIWISLLQVRFRPHLETDFRCRIWVIHSTYGISVCRACFVSALQHASTGTLNPAMS